MGFVDQLVSGVNDPWTIYLYGDFGSGKSVLAAQAPKPLHLDLERSRRSFKNHEETKDIQSWDCFNSWPKFSTAIAELMKPANREELDQYETIIVDTVTRLQRINLRKEVREAYQKDNNRHPLIASQFEYNVNNTAIEDAILKLMGLGKNLILVGQVREERDNEGTTVVIRPGNSPALVTQLATMVDGIFYLESRTDSKGDTKRKLITIPSSVRTGKNRFAGMPATMENPTFDKILAAMQDTAVKAITK